MEIISTEVFINLPALDDNPRVRLMDGNVIKLCNPKIEFLTELSKYKIQHFSTPESILEEQLMNCRVGYLTKSKYFNNYIALSELDFSKYSSKDLLILFKNIFSSLKEANSVGLFVNDIHYNNILINPDNLDYQFFDFDMSLILKNDEILRENEDVYEEIMLQHEKKRCFSQYPNDNIKENLILEENHYMLYTLMALLHDRNLISCEELTAMLYLSKELKLPKCIDEKLNYAYTYKLGFEPDDYFEQDFDYLINSGYTIKKVK